ncbi:MAG: laccase domain protein [Micavibrio sp.]|nr:MAG: laccase domain protein [Micavibrio sp.]
MAQPLHRPDSKDIYFDMPPFLDNEKGPAFYGFFGRQGGVSKDVYSSLNCGIGSEDNPGNVQKNRDKIAEIAGVTPDNFITIHQTHSDKCLVVEEPWSIHERPEADAFVTTVPGIALGILTADCAPVLFYGESDGKPVIGAAHAGWGGALKGILESTVKAMNDLGVQSEDIRACVGPCIGKASYEVTEKFGRPFWEEDDDNERFFQSARKEGHLMFDLAGYCAGKLSKAGLRNVFIKDLDTYFNEEDFFSYRRATHRREKDYGRQVSVIAIRK